MHGMQAWIALPREDEEVDPAFAHHDADALPELSDRGVCARLIAGSAYGLSNSVRTFSPLFYLHAELESGASIAMPTDHTERAAYVVSGTVVHDGTRHTAGRLLVFASGGEPAITAEDGPARLMLLGGAGVGPRFIWWNLVSSRSERIEQAKADWKSGRMALPPDDDREFIPLPEDPPPQAEPA
jgi:redox-sensitive bicupin YhaK (pirin superfamily)